MFRYSNHIDNIGSYEVQENFIYLTKGVREQQSVFYNGELVLSNVCSFVKNLSNEFVFYTWDLKVYRRNDSVLKLILEGYSLNEEKYDNETIFVSKKIAPGKYTKSLYNFKTERLGKEITHVPVIVSQTMEIYYTADNIIRKKSRVNDLYNWEVDLGGRKYINPLKEERNVTIVRIIGIEDNQLIIFMSNKELISIDIETGNILWETKDFIETKLPKYPDYRMVSSIFYYGILENGKFYQLQGNNYFSIDLHTQQVDILWEDKSETDYLTFQYTSYTEDYIYFTGSRNNLFSPYLIGAFNRKTMQVDWVHEPDSIVNPLTNAPHYVNGKLYILDSGGILHIYEKE